MSDLPPDLPRLRVLETWLLYMLDRVRRKIAFLERRESERRRGDRERPPVPDWTVEMGIGHGRPPVYVHVGGCPTAGGRLRPVGRAAAVRALTEGTSACPHCRPDSALGLLE
ncbi:DUF6233 domain-containing protein [Streptomyces sp. TS71-3]|uniref:DUF6233 domain-containing protein n=1 Tax=Streptomyces sp. TS71-3 TaxID=2733862 RepID=UPI001B2C4F7C|nr:DUF6233 domain-containing protein [Streptomyces sp. TS71-3]GHJ40762.1 hypothetical protein Sm713_63710 [Streptomyces sp. TS71-3]